MFHPVICRSPKWRRQACLCEHRGKQTRGLFAERHAVADTLARVLLELSQDCGNPVLNMRDVLGRRFHEAAGASLSSRNPSGFTPPWSRRGTSTAALLVLLPPPPACLLLQRGQPNKSQPQAIGVIWFHTCCLVALWQENEEGISCCTIWQVQMRLFSRVCDSLDCMRCSSMSAPHLRECSNSGAQTVALHSTCSTTTDTDSSAGWKKSSMMLREQHCAVSGTSVLSKLSFKGSLKKEHNDAVQVQRRSSGSHLKNN